MLDGYTSNAALTDLSGFDNSGFTNSLRKKGFYVASQSKSNYSITYLSLAGTLQMDYINNRLGGLTNANREPVYNMIRHNRVVEELHERGYSYVHFH